MALPEDHLNEDDGPIEIDSASGIWKRSPGPSPSRTLHDARNLVFALKATLVWLDELCATQGASVEVREGIEDLSAVSDRLNGLLTEALGTGAVPSDRRGAHRQATGTTFALPNRQAGAESARSKRPQPNWR